MYNRILVPLDGSNAAEIVLPYAGEIAAKFSTEIILISISESDITDMSNLYSSYLKNITKQVQRQLKEYGAKEEIKVHSEVVSGNPADEILRYADESNVDLIAMASRGSSGQGPWLLGNIVAKVLRATSMPVLLIRVPASDVSIRQKRLVKRILVPLDGSNVGETAIPCTEALARSLDAELVLLQVVGPITTWAGYDVGGSYPTIEEEESRKAVAITYLNGVAKQLEERGINTSCAISLGSPANQIIDYATANDIDLIAMSTHGRSGIGRWVFGSVTDKVLHAGDSSVLLVRTAKA